MRNDLLINTTVEETGKCAVIFTFSVSQCQIEVGGNCHVRPINVDYRWLWSILRSRA